MRMWMGSEDTRGGIRRKVPHLQTHGLLVQAVYCHRLTQPRRLSVRGSLTPDCFFVDL